MTGLKELASFLFNAEGVPKVAVQVISVVAFWFFLGWSLGFTPVFGAGFARAETMNRVEASLIETAILNRRIRYCTAPDGSETKLFFFRIVNEKLAEYFSLTNISYSLPTCPELVYATD